MNSKDIKFFAAELGAQIPELDLHGTFPSEALEKMEIFLYDCICKKEKMARIIYGGGTGALREAVLQALKNHPAIEDKKDCGGNCIVIF